MRELKEKILAEINRRKDGLRTQEDFPPEHQETYHVLCELEEFIKSIFKEPDGRVFYLHVAYQTSDCHYKPIFGDTILAIKEGTTIAEIREIVLQNCKYENSDIEWHLPQLTSITELSKDLYESLTTENKIKGIDYDRL